MCITGLCTGREVWTPLDALYVPLSTPFLISFTCDISILSSPHVQYLVTLAYSFVADVIGFGYYFERNDSSFTSESPLVLCSCTYLEELTL